MNEAHARSACQRSALTESLQSSCSLGDSQLPSCWFFAALAARGEQPFVANRRGSALSALCEFATCVVKVGYRKLAPTTLGRLRADNGHRSNASGALMSQNRLLHRRRSAWSPVCRTLPKVTSSAIFAISRTPGQRRC